MVKCIFNLDTGKNWKSQSSRDIATPRCTIYNLGLDRTADLVDGECIWESKLKYLFGNYRYFLKGLTSPLKWQVGAS